jgi:hypothetical protein
VDAWIVGRRARYAPRLAAAMVLVMGAGAAALAAGWGQIQKDYFDFADSQYRVYNAMLGLPDDAVVVAGPGTPVAAYLNRLGQKHFTVIGSGWGWPGRKLADIITAHRRRGLRVFVDPDVRDWTRALRRSGEYEVLREVLADYRLETSHWPMVELLPPTATSGASNPATVSAPARK